MVIDIDIVPETLNGPCFTVIALQFGRTVGVRVAVSVMVGVSVAVGDNVAVGDSVTVGERVGEGVLVGVGVASSTSTVSVSLLVRCPASPL